MKKIFCLLLAVIMMLSMVACGSSESPADETVVEENAENTESEASGDKKVVAFVPYLMAEEFSADVSVGIQNACEARGWEALELDPNGDLTMQLQFFEDLLVQGVDAVVFQTIDTDSDSAAVDEMKAAGIVTIDFDCIVEQGNTDATIVSTDETGGAYAAQQLAERMGYQGTVMVYEENPGIGTILWRNDGFREWMAENAPDITVLNNRPQDGTRDGARAWAVDMLTAYPEITGFFGACGDYAIGIYYGVKESGREDVVIMGYDATTDQAKIMEQDGEDCQLIGSVALHPKKIGRVCVETIEQIMNGEYVRQSTDEKIYVDTGYLDAKTASEFVNEE